MPLYHGLRKFVTEQDEVVRSGAFDLDSQSRYLLGFDKEGEKALPLKRYIRRLWLAFQSGKSLHPKYFFDKMAEDFSKEINELANGLAKDPLKLSAELWKDALDLVGESCRERGFLEEVVDTLLITRRWGDALWGDRRFSNAVLFNAKPEPGHDTPPGVAKRQGSVSLVPPKVSTETLTVSPRISLAVRQWLAADIQERILRKQRDKDVPRVDAPDPKQRRISLAAMGPTEEERETSAPPELPLQSPGEQSRAVNVLPVQVKAENDTQPLTRRALERLAAGPSTTRQRTKTTTVERSATHAGIPTPIPSSSHMSPAAIVAERSSITTRSATKRKHDDEQSAPRKRARSRQDSTSQPTCKPSSHKQTSTPVGLERGQSTRSNVVSNVNPQEEDAAANHNRAPTPTLPIAGQESREGLGVTSRDPTRSSTPGNRQPQGLFDGQATSDSVPPAPVSPRTSHPNTQGEKSIASPAPSPISPRASHSNVQAEKSIASPAPSVCTKWSLADEDTAGVEDKTARPRTRPSTNRTGSPRAPSTPQNQVLTPEASLANSTTSKSLANPEPIAARSTKFSNEFANDMESAEHRPNHKHDEVPAIVHLPSSASGRKTSQEPFSETNEKPARSVYTPECVSQFGSADLERNAQSDNFTVCSDEAKEGVSEESPDCLEDDLGIFSNLMRELRYEARAKNDENERTTNAASSRTVPGQGSDSHQYQYSVVGGDESYPNLDPPAAASPQKNVSTVCEASLATESFLEELQTDHSEDDGPNRPSCRIPEETALLPSHCDKVMEQDQRRNGQEVTSETASELNNAFVSTHSHEVPREALCLTSPVLYKDNHNVSVSSQHATSHSETPPALIAPFPPGTRPDPPRCTQCRHSLEKTVDVMKDQRGYAQWKKVCIYCRGLSGHRSLPCHCYTCQHASKEVLVEVSTQATLVADQDCTSLAEHIQPLTTPATAEPTFKSPPWLDPGLDEALIGSSQDSPIDLTASSGAIAPQNGNGSDRPSDQSVAESPLMNVPELSSLEPDTSMIGHEHTLQSTSPEQTPQPSDSSSVLNTSPVPTTPQRKRVYLNNRNPSGLQDSIRPRQQQSRGALFEREPHVDVSRPFDSPITPPATVRGDYEPHDVSQVPNQNSSRPAPLGRFVPGRASPRANALSRMAHSLEFIFNGSIDVNKVLDWMFPNIEHEFLLKMREVQEPDKTHSAKPMNDLLRITGTLRELRMLSLVPKLPNTFDRNAARVSNDGLESSRLEQLNSWITSTASSGAMAEFIRLLALCHDLILLTGEMVRQEPNIPDHNLYLEIIEIYDKQLQYIQEAYSVDGEIFSRHHIPAASAYTTPQNAPLPHECVANASTSWSLPRIGTVFEGTSDLMQLPPIKRDSHFNTQHESRGEGRGSITNNQGKGQPLEPRLTR
ncbi:hypothetical protein OPT61_g1282 [Boeremia exigua]|uniref:Uncharacterized protein n=1 Tax=Boeremia exigua TaxID=749465 RepID=A0ACC2IQV0_9PLEO|nr:hypothetical protein OPT61_g1282 [Boeremia exigua]